MEKQKPKFLFVYNLQFPSYCNTIDIFGYNFTRVKEYQERLKSLHHTFSSISEYERKMNLGTHANTAIVNCPVREKKAILPWDKKDDRPHALDDISLLLSIFTGRHVFTTPFPIDDGKHSTYCDPRSYPFDLRTTIPYEAQTKNDIFEYDIGFERGIKKVYELMNTEEWQQKYDNGRFLFLFHSAIKPQIIETSFLTCWTIWEHLFTLHNQAWMSEREIKKLPVAEKIAYLIIEYNIKNVLDDKDRKGIKRFANIRHRLVHAGQFPNKQSIEDASLFVRVTLMVVATILGVIPRNVPFQNYAFIQSLAGRPIPDNSLDLQNKQSKETKRKR